MSANSQKRTFPRLDEEEVVGVQIGYIDTEQRNLTAATQIDHRIRTALAEMVGLKVGEVVDGRHVGNVDPVAGAGASAGADGKVVDRILTVVIGEHEQIVAAAAGKGIVAEAADDISPA